MRYGIAHILNDVITPMNGVAFTELEVRQYCFRKFVNAVKSSRLDRGHREMWRVIRDTATDLNLDPADFIDARDILYDQARKRRKGTRRRS